MGNMLGKERIYNKEFAKMGLENVVRWDVMDIENVQEIYLEFLSANSKYRQGIRLAVDTGEGYIEINGMKSKGIQLWEDTCPKKTRIKCYSSEGKLSIYNIFDLGRERGGIRSQMDSSGMLIEEMDMCRIYRCNDLGFECDFNKLVFKIEIV